MPAYMVPWVCKWKPYIAITGGGKNCLYKGKIYGYYRFKKGGRVTNQHSEALQNPDFFGDSTSKHSAALDVEGLDHIFRWASDMVADGEDSRVKLAREKRIRRQVLEVVQKVKEQKALTEAQEEVGYLQRRVIALLQKLQEVTEENNTAKNLIVSQYYQLQRIPSLEHEIRQLRGMEYEREAAVTERRYLMNALAGQKPIAINWKKYLLPAKLRMRGWRSYWLRLVLSWKQSNPGNGGTGLCPGRRRADTFLSALISRRKVML